MQTYTTEETVSIKNTSENVPQLESCVVVAVVVVVAATVNTIINIFSSLPFKSGTTILWWRVHT